MKPAEIRAMDDAKLNQRVADLLAEWRALRFQEAVGQLTATARTRQIRKDIARIKTSSRRCLAAGTANAERYCEERR